MIGEVLESQLMAECARAALGFSGLALLDQTSRSTWQNIENAIPLIGEAGLIKIVPASLRCSQIAASSNQPEALPPCRSANASRNTDSLTNTRSRLHRESLDY